VTDNGAGMPHESVPDLLGRVLSGTKYGVCQTRGKFGLGAKMALIWSKMSTGLPIDVRTSTSPSGGLSHTVLDIDIHRNEPNVHSAAVEANPGRWRGTALAVTIEGSWTYARSKVLRYLRQIAVITPYAQFKFAYEGEGGKGSLALTFARRTDVVPPPPAPVKHHPASVDLELVKRLLTTTRAPTLRAFLAREFSCVSKAHADRLAAEARAGMAPDTDPRTLDAKQAARLHQLLHEAKFDDPSGDHLSPAGECGKREGGGRAREGRPRRGSPPSPPLPSLLGEYNLRLGITKEFRPDLVATHQGEARVLEGHAFVVEAAVSLGGRGVKPGINVHRFANRIPLLFEAGSDVITRTATKRVNWAAYKISQATDRVGVFVSVVSTRIPYKGAGKEYIADDMDDMVAAVKAAVQACGVQLKVKIARAAAAREQAHRKKNLAKYVPNAAAALFAVMEAMADAPAVGGKRRKLEAARDILSGVRDGTTTEATLVKRLTEHVEKADTDAALEFQMQQGLAATGGRVDAWLVPDARGGAGAARHGPDLDAGAAIVRLLLP
jgi:DNA topoisomerase VI subunit B